MKHINLQSVIEAYRNLESSLFQKLMNSYGIIVGGLNGIKDYELDGIGMTRIESLHRIP
jgi:hypothetical protein